MIDAFLLGLVDLIFGVVGGISWSLLARINLVGCEMGYWGEVVIGFIVVLAILALFCFLGL